MKYLLPFFLLSFFDCQRQAPKPALPPPVVTTPPAQAEPPAPIAETPQPPDYDTAQWTEIIRLDASVLLDLRYATENNFVKEKMYDCPRCFFRKEVANALIEVHKELKKKGLGLKMFDCYRPRPIQWKLWNKVPNPDYVADPRKGSMHNRGMAADLTITDLKGVELDMGTEFDFFGEKAYHDFTDLPAQVLENRKLLLETMEAHRFRHTRTEWWHYSYVPKTFELSDWLWKCPTTKQK